MFLEKIMSNQKKQLDSFKYRIEKQVDKMKLEISKVNTRIGVLQRERDSQENTARNANEKPSFMRN